MQGFGGGNLRERVHLEDISVDDRVFFFEMDLKVLGLEGVELIWLRTGIGGELL